MPQQNDNLAGPVVVQLAGLASCVPSPVDGQWLVEYDPTRRGVSPTGQPTVAHLKVSPDRADARVFPNAVEAHRYWNAESGRPYPQDRPLTFYNAMVEPAELTAEEAPGA